MTRSWPWPGMACGWKNITRVPRTWNGPWTTRETSIFCNPGPWGWFTPNPNRRRCPRISPITRSCSPAARPRLPASPWDRSIWPQGDPSRPLPDDAILVARTASPDHARLMGKIKGIITDIGSVTSHLASVAREFGVPALFDAGQATARLSDGEPITLMADRATVYQGIVPELAAAAKPLKRHLW